MSTKPKNQRNNSLQLAITSYGLQSVTGNQDFALFGAIATMLNASAEDPLTEVPSPDGYGSNPAIIAPIQKFEEYNPGDRMIMCLQNAILDAIERLPPVTLNGVDKKQLFMIITPATVFERSRTINIDSWKEFLKEELDEFSASQVHFINADANVTKNLQIALAAINEGKFDTLIFAGVDSLVNDITCNELVTQNKLCSNTISDGVIPGEAAACVVIEKIDAKKTNALAIIKNLAFAEEPNSGKPHLKQLSGLSQAIQSVTQQAGQLPDDIDCIIRNSTTEQHFELEWYQTTQRIWSNKLSEKDRVAYQLGELDEPPKLKSRKLPEELKTSYTLGEIGAASIPLNLVLAGARFDFNYPVVKNCLICEANEFLFRGAILLQNPRITSQADLDKRPDSSIR
ncbi:MAG: hypothetical protein ACC707_17570 [Thiohalomonadales bacterium]